MSAINFFFRGTESKQKEYRRDQYPEEGNEITRDLEKAKALDELPGDVTDVVTKDKYEYITIDDVYTFNVINDQIRNTCSTRWAQLAKNSKKICVITAIIGLGGFALIPAFPFISVAVTIVAISIVLLGVSACALRRCIQANKQLKLWANPSDRFILDYDNDLEIIKIKQEQEIRKKQMEKESLLPEHEKVREFKLKLSECLKEINVYKSKIKELESIDIAKIASEEQEFIECQELIAKNDQEIEQIKAKINPDVSDLELDNKLKNCLELKQLWLKRKEGAFTTVQNRYQDQIDYLNLKIKGEIFKLDVPIFGCKLYSISKDDLLKIIRSHLRECPELASLEIK